MPVRHLSHTAALHLNAYAKFRQQQAPRHRRMNEGGGVLTVVGSRSADDEARLGAVQAPRAFLLPALFRDVGETMAAAASSMQLRDARLWCSSDDGQVR